MPEKIELSSNLVNQILAYIQTKPFQEVAGLIQALHQEVQPQVQAKVPPDMPVSE